MVLTPRLPLKEQLVLQLVEYCIYKYLVVHIKEIKVLDFYLKKRSKRHDL